nr:MAG TPA: hypothetical protein [Caudoviricetes sp.]
MTPPKNKPFRTPLEPPHGQGIKSPPQLAGRSGQRKAPGENPGGCTILFLIYCFFKSSINTATGKKRIARIFT